MSLAKQSAQLDRWIREYGDLSATELAIRLQDLMVTGYIGPGGAVKGRIMEGEAVAVAQLLYNKLVESGKISGSQMRVDGAYGSKTGNAIYKIRELVGGTYLPEDRKQLKNPNVERSLDRYSVESLVKLLTLPKVKIVKEVPTDVKGQLEALERDLDFLDARCETYRESSAFSMSIDTSPVHRDLAELKERFRKGDWNVVKAEIALMQIEVSDMHYMLSALNALVALEGGSRPVGSTNQYFKALGTEKLKSLKHALEKGSEIARSKGLGHPDFFGACDRNIAVIDEWFRAHGL